MNHREIEHGLQERGYRLQTACAASWRLALLYPVAEHHVMEVGITEVSMYTMRLDLVKPRTLSFQIAEERRN